MIFVDIRHLVEGARKGVHDVLVDPLETSWKEMERNCLCGARRRSDAAGREEQ